MTGEQSTGSLGGESIDNGRDNKVMKIGYFERHVQITEVGFMLRGVCGMRAVVNIMVAEVRVVKLVTPKGRQAMSVDNRRQKQLQHQHYQASSLYNCKGIFC